MLISGILSELRTYRLSRYSDVTKVYERSARVNMIRSQVIRHRLSAWRTAHGVSAVASPQDVLGARRALDSTAAISAWPAIVTQVTEEDQIWPSSGR